MMRRSSVKPSITNSCLMENLHTASNRQMSAKAGTSSTLSPSCVETPRPKQL
jgi:hypothetical protein